MDEVVKVELVVKDELVVEGEEVSTVDVPTEVDKVVAEPTKAAGVEVVAVLDSPSETTLPLASTKTVWVISTMAVAASLL